MTFSKTAPPLDSSALNVACSLAYDAHKDYYGRLFMTESQLLTSIAAELIGTQGELSSPILSYRNDDLAGIACCYPSSSLSERQFQSLRMLSQGGGLEPRALVELKKFRNELPEPLEGMYLARIAVSALYRRQAVGRELMQQVEAKARKAQLDSVWAYVLSTNESALKFYQSLGYQIQDPNKNYVTIRKELSKR